MGIENEAADEEAPCPLTSTDSHGCVGLPTFYQRHVILGQQSEGFWTISVTEAGADEIAIPSWPAEIDGAIGEFPDSLAAFERVAASQEFHTGRCHAARHRDGQLLIDEPERSMQIDAEATAATFKLPSTPGRPPTTLGWSRRRENAGCLLRRRLRCVLAQGRSNRAHSNYAPLNGAAAIL